MIAPTKYGSRTVAIRHVKHPKGPHSYKPGLSECGPSEAPDEGREKGPSVRSEKKCF